MFPIIWRYLLSHYFKVMGLCIAAFIAVILTTRLDEIARFAVISPSFKATSLFVLFQIPYILPIVIPISCLISAIILVQRLSKTHELTAFRACGVSLKDFLTPILFSATLMASLNLFIVSELATSSHFRTGMWKEELRALNPLLLLRNKHLMKVKGGVFNTLGDSKTGENAQQVVMGLPNKNHSRITLFLAQELIANADHLQGRGVSLITAIPGSGEDSFDQIVIDNMAETETLTADFSQIMQQNAWKINNDYLTMDLLLARLREEKKRYAIEKESQAVQTTKENINRCYSEITRRVSVAIAALTFTLLGLSFGISINRTPSIKKVFYVIFLAGLYLTAFFAAKGADHLLLRSILLYTVPHLLIITSSVIVLIRISRGIEGR
jgi:lipopolysaccharide export system permease protein